MMAFMSHEFLKHFKYFKHFIFMTALYDRYFTITILKMRKLRLRKVKWFSQGRIASKSQDQDSKQEDSLQASRVFASSIYSTEGEKRKTQNFGRPVKIKNE